MQLSNHETDLYILPDNDEERKSVIAFLKEKNWNWDNSYSNVEGQSWYGKRFIEVPFGKCIADEMIAKLGAQSMRARRRVWEKHCGETGAQLES